MAYRGKAGERCEHFKKGGKGDGNGRRGGGGEKRLGNIFIYYVFDVALE